MKISFLDAIFLVIVLLPAIICSIKGFIKEVFGMGALVLGIWAAALFYKLLTPFLAKYIHIQFLAIALSFLIIFLVVYLVVMIVRAVIGQVFDNDFFKNLDHFLGFVFGALEGLAIVAVILILIAGQPWFDVSELLDHSFFYHMMKWFIAAPAQSISNVVDTEKIIPIKTKGAK